MHVRSLCFVATLLSAGHAMADDGQQQVRAAYAPGGDAVRLVVKAGGKKPGVVLAAGKSKPAQLHAGEASATLEAGHGRVVIALAVDSKKEPFRILALEDGKLGKPIALARPNKRHDFPFAVALATTPTGFTVFFQEVEYDNPNEAHTYMVELDKDGTASGELREVQVPWSLAAAAWNGKGYHLGLFYTGDMNGARLSMVSLTKDGSPEQHPDWASSPGMISDVHLVTGGGKIRAYYRGSAGDRLLETDVTKIGQWGQVATKAKDHGALASNVAIAITAKGAPAKIKSN